ncbi:mitochondrial ribosomal protein L37-domain-containing protein [Pisolithus tinctorius]|nr:mitochondrial ribosomal protein L37-domain-containing protein [Pisolithus tinctorius]
MSLLVCPRASPHRRLAFFFSRTLAIGPRQAGSASAEKKPSTAKSATSPSLEDLKPPISSCPAGTVLTGLNYLKGQPPVLAMPDADYPSWLWDLTNPKKRSRDAEKRRLRRENRQLLRDKNKFGAR